MQKNKFKANATFCALVLKPLSKKPKKNKKYLFKAKSRDLVVRLIITERSWVRTSSEENFFSFGSKHEKNCWTLGVDVIKLNYGRKLRRFHNSML